MTRKYLLGVAIFAFILIIIVGGFVIRLLTDWVSSSPIDYPLQQADSFLKTVATTPGVPDGFPISCWNLLQEAMERNSNQYTLIVAGVYGDNGTPVPGDTGSDTVLIEAVFPDGVHVEMNFYANTLNSCQELTDVQLPIE